MNLGLVVVVLSVLAAGCTGPDASPEATSDPSTATPSIDAATTTSLAIASAAEPDVSPEFTEFEYTNKCDPTAADANLQAVQAFVTAYNERDEDRLSELVAESVTIADMSGIPHLGVDEWTGVTGWAQKGWSAADRFELSRLVMYDSGSVFDVERRNEVLTANGIESLYHSWKVHSSDCVISHMVLYLPFEELGEAECLYWETFLNAIVDGTTQEIHEPEVCSG